MSALLSLLLLALGAQPDAGSAMTRSERPPMSTVSPDLTTSPGGAAGAGLPKESIRQVIDLHINEAKYCYEMRLKRNAELFGRIMVKFTISDSGSVIASTLESSTMHDDWVERCLVAAVRRWPFPAPPGGGAVVVWYPFVFTPTRPLTVLGEASGEGTLAITFLDINTIVHRSTNAQGIPSNGLIAVTDRGLLLVDTAWTEPETEALLKWGEEHLQRRWIRAVITHDHPDRDGGLGALRRRRIPVAALDLTVAKLARRGLHGVTTLFTAHGGEFTDPRGFEAFYPGPGHTTDNIVLSFPTVLYGGCLIKSMEAQDLGFTGDANLAAWPEAVRRVSERYAEMVIIPGHGPVDRTFGAFQHTLDLLAAARKK